MKNNSNDFNAHEAFKQYILLAKRITQRICEDSKIDHSEDSVVP